MNVMFEIIVVCLFGLDVVYMYWFELEMLDDSRFNLFLFIIKCFVFDFVIEMKFFI